MIVLVTVVMFCVGDGDAYDGSASGDGTGDVNNSDGSVVM